MDKYASVRRSDMFSHSHVPRSLAPVPNARGGFGGMRGRGGGVSGKFDQHRDSGYGERAKAQLMNRAESTGFGKGSTGWGKFGVGKVVADGEDGGWGPGSTPMTVKQKSTSPNAGNQNCILDQPPSSPYGNSAINIHPDRLRMLGGPPQTKSVDRTQESSFDDTGSFGSQGGQVEGGHGGDKRPDGLVFVGGRVRRGVVRCFCSRRQELADRNQSNSISPAANDRSAANPPHPSKAPWSEWRAAEQAQPRTQSRTLDKPTSQLANQNQPVSVGSMCLLINQTLMGNS